jgi:hypothetical protein
MDLRRPSPRPRSIAVLLLLCLLNIAEAHSQQAPVKPADFNFVLRYGSAAQLILDTSKGTFTRDADLPSVAMTIDLKLTADQMNEVFRGLARIDFWNDTKYPKSFSYPPPTPGTGGASVVPCGLYVFSVTVNGQVKDLSWEDCWISRSPTYAPADELREVFRTIHRFIQSKPEYKALPPSKAPPRI